MVLIVCYIGGKHFVGAVGNVFLSMSSIALLAAEDTSGSAAKRGDNASRTTMVLDALHWWQKLCSLYAADYCWKQRVQWQKKILTYPAVSILRVSITVAAPPAQTMQLYKFLEASIHFYMICFLTIYIYFLFSIFWVCTQVCRTKVRRYHRSFARLRAGHHHARPYHLDT